MRFRSFCTTSRPLRYFAICSRQLAAVPEPPPPRPFDGHSKACHSARPTAERSPRKELSVTQSHLASCIQFVTWRAPAAEERRDEKRLGAAAT
ncbi:hypothetical protein NHX12_001694 [Muraenolepis orangiensis]|uniref:Uncharacterized protein n=1 Tax=Muraenolepis orangiensis TaxID=630683 RepID=A0A9Q0IHH4_9TELE|nr:hypothetical protein NHX12_001694 [Muraenolepis orangiensis]